MEKEKKNYEETIEDKRKRIILFFKRKGTSYLYYISGLLIILFGVFIRTRNLKSLQWKYPLALDPYIFLRYARYYLEQGDMKSYDSMRYFPLGLDVSNENLMVSYVVAFMYKFFAFFSDSITLEAVHIIYPVIFFFLGTVFFYLLVKELFDHKVALLSTGILVVLPSFLYRTMAGFSDKEPLGLFFMFSSLYFFFKSFKSKNFSVSLIYASLAGSTTGMMGLSWGGFKFLLLVIPLYTFVMLLAGKLSAKHFSCYLSWTAIFTFIITFFTNKYGSLTDLFKSTTSGFSYFVLLFFFICLIFPKLKNNKNFMKNKYLMKLFQKTRILAIGGGVLFTFFMFFIIKTGIFSFVFNEVRTILISGMGGDRLMMTVAEARLPYFIDWLDTFKSFFFVFFFGSIYIFYFLVKTALGKKRAIITTLSFSALISGIIFSRVSKYSRLGGNSTLSYIFLFLPVAVFILVFGAGYIVMIFRNKKVYSRLAIMNEGYIFLLVWFIIMVIAARSGMRLFLVLAPVASAVAGFFVINALKKASKLKDKFYKYTAYFFVLVIICPGISGFAITSYSNSRYYSPSFNSQWQSAMDWVKSSTPENSVFAHWWDYGYWVQAEGKRATITDGGNFISYWNHLMGRHVLAAGSASEALEFLYVHNATHILIISDEIGKYTAYSSIGSDENFDIFSWIGTFTMDSSATTENKEKGIFNYFFRGSVALDEDITFNDRVFPAKESYILMFKIPVLESDDEIKVQQPVAVVYYDGDREDIPVECVYDDGGGKHFFNKSGLKGCVRIMPVYLDQKYQRENGALLYISGKGMKALWTHLFLFNEDVPYFELVYDDSNINPLVYYSQNVHGPLKIWKINYPDNFTVSDKIRKEYLSRTTPAWMNLSRLSVLDE